MPRPLYPRRKSPRYPLDRRLDGTQNRCEEEKNPQPPPGINSPNPDLVARREALYRLIPRLCSALRSCQKLLEYMTCKHKQTELQLEICMILGSHVCILDTQKHQAWRWKIFNFIFVYASSIGRGMGRAPSTFITCYKPLGITQNTISIF